MNRFLIVLFLSFLSPVTAHAQCTMPNGKPDAEAGVIVFNTDHKVMQYCNGEQWVGMRSGSGSGLPGCGDGEITQFIGGEWICNDGSGIGNLNAANLSTGTVPRARLGSGAANDTTFLRGDGTWAAPSSGAGGDYQVFTANGTWTKPSDGSVVLIQCWGGGASGGALASSGSVRVSSGGGGGGYSEATLPISLLPATASVVIGAGGTGNSQPGGMSRFGTYVYAYGGKPGTAIVMGGGLAGAGGKPGTAGGEFSGVTIWQGGFSTTESSSSPAPVMYGGGGGCGMGIVAGTECSVGGTSLLGGNGGAPNGTDAQTPGGGGAGGKPASTAGKAGARGECRIMTW